MRFKVNAFFKIASIALVFLVACTNSDTYKSDSDVTSALDVEVVTVNPTNKITSKASKYYSSVNMFELPVYIGMTPLEVENSLGKPIEKNNYNIIDRKLEWFEYIYDFGYVHFYPNLPHYSSTHAVSKIVVKDVSFEGPKQCVIGETVDSIFQKLKLELPLLEQGKKIVYQQGTPVGFVIYNDSKKVDKIELVCDENDSRISFYFIDNILKDMRLYFSEISLEIEIDSKMYDIFHPANSSLMNIKIGSSFDDVEKILGKPKNIKKEYLSATGNVITYYYEFGSIEFIEDYNFEVTTIKVDKVGYELNRTLQVGDSIEGAFRKLGIDSKLQTQGSEYSTIIYNEPNRMADIHYNNKEAKRITFFYGEDWLNYAINFESGSITSIVLYIPLN